MNRGRPDLRGQNYPYEYPSNYPYSNPRYADHHSYDFQKKLDYNTYYNAYYNTYFSYDTRSSRYYEDTGRDRQRYYERKSHEYTESSVAYTYNENNYYRNLRETHSYSEKNYPVQYKKTTPYHHKTKPFTSLIQNIQTGSKEMGSHLVEVFKSPNLNSLKELYEKIKNYDLSVDIYCISQLSRLLCAYMRENFTLFYNKIERENNPELNEIFSKIVKVLFTQSALLFVDNDLNNALFKKRFRLLEEITYILFHFGHLSQRGVYSFSGSHMEYLLKKMKSRLELGYKEEMDYEKYVSLSMSALGKLASHESLIGYIDAEYINFLLEKLLIEFRKLTDKYKDSKQGLDKDDQHKAQSIGIALFGIGDLVDETKVKFTNRLNMKTICALYNELLDFSRINEKLFSNVYPSLCTGAGGLGRLVKNNYVNFSVYLPINQVFVAMRAKGNSKSEVNEMANLLYSASELAGNGQLQTEIIYMDNINYQLEKANFSEICPSPEEIGMIIFGFGGTALKLEGSVIAGVINKLIAAMLDIKNYNKITVHDLSGTFNGLNKLIKANKILGCVNAELISKLLRKAEEFRCTNKLSTPKLKAISAFLSKCVAKPVILQGQIDIELLNKYYTSGKYDYGNVAAPISTKQVNLTAPEKSSALQDIHTSERETEYKKINKKRKASSIGLKDKDNTFQSKVKNTITFFPSKPNQTIYNEESINKEGSGQTYIVPTTSTEISSKNPNGLVMQGTNPVENVVDEDDEFFDKEAAEEAVKALSGKLSIEDEAVKGMLDESFDIDELVIVMDDDESFDQLAAENALNALPADLDIVDQAVHGMLNNFFDINELLINNDEKVKLPTNASSIISSSSFFNRKDPNTQVLLDRRGNVSRQNKVVNHLSTPPNASFK